MEIGFCDAATGRGFQLAQPDNQLERWELPVDNGTHLTILWRADRRACGYNVSAYKVDFWTSMPWLNRVASVFGGFPQDICGASSVARAAVALDGDVSGEQKPSACSPYPSGCHKTVRESVVAVPLALRALARLDIKARTHTLRARTHCHDPSPRVIADKHPRVGCARADRKAGRKQVRPLPSIPARRIAG